jgi:hypothetical protein
MVLDGPCLPNTLIAYFRIWAGLGEYMGEGMVLMSSKSVNPVETEGVC